jgi:hypothetical protein
MDLRHLVHEVFHREQVAVPKHHRSVDERSMAVAEMASTCAATRPRRSSQQFRAEQRRRTKRQRRLATIPHTAGHAGRRVGGAECKAHAGINDRNLAWANLLSFITLRTEALSKDNHKMSYIFTDLPQTWEEYQIIKQGLKAATPKQAHHAFLHCLQENNMYVSTPNGVLRRNPTAFRFDPLHEASHVLATLASPKAKEGQDGHLEDAVGYATPFDKTFDESGHQYTISKGWSLALTLEVLEATKEVVVDAEMCMADLTGRLETPTSQLSAKVMPHVCRESVRIACLLAYGTGQELIKALDKVVRQKQSYAEMIIATKMPLFLDGVTYHLHNFDGQYFYVNNDGDNSLPF